MCGKYKLVKIDTNCINFARIYIKNSTNLVKSSQILIYLATFTFYAIIYTNANKQSLALMEGQS